MFEKLRKKIIFGIVAVALLFALVLGGVSYAVIVRNAFAMQAARVRQNVENGAKGCETYVEAVQGFVNGVAAKHTVADKIVGCVYDSEIKQLLNGFYNYAVAVGGVTLYGANNYVTYSAGMGVVPSFEELLTIDEIAAFWQSDKTEFVSVRNNVVPGVYGNTTYNTGWGVVSCICKVYGEDGNAVGMLVADILPTSLYEAKLAYEGFDLPCQAFVTDDGNVYGGKAELLPYISVDGCSSDGRYYVVSTKFADGARVVMLASLSSFVGYCFAVAGVMIVVVGLVALCVVAFARYISRCMSEPLCQLLIRMASDEHKLSQLSGR